MPTMQARGLESGGSMKISVHGVEITGRDLVHVLIGSVVGVAGVFAVLIYWLGQI